MGKEGDSEWMRELQLLEALAEEPVVRQADLAARLGIAVGTVNWLLKRLAAKGYVKVKKIGRWRWRYLLTPRGFAEKARLTQRYLQDSMSLYRQTRREVRRLLAELQKRGYTQVRLEEDPENDLVDVCRLTCLEQGITVSNPRGDLGGEEEMPVLRVDGRELFLNWPKEGGDG